MHTYDCLCHSSIVSSTCYTSWINPPLVAMLFEWYSTAVLVKSLCCSGAPPAGHHDIMRGVRSRYCIYNPLDVPLLSAGELDPSICNISTYYKASIFFQCTTVWLVPCDTQHPCIMEPYRQQWQETDWSGIWNIGACTCMLLCSRRLPHLPKDKRLHKKTVIYHIYLPLKRTIQKGDLFE